MPTKIKHAYKIGDRIRLASGRVVLITKLRKTAGSEVRFEPLRNQPWYEGVDTDRQVFTFPQTCIEAILADDPSASPTRCRRVLAEKQDEAPGTWPEVKIKARVREGVLLTWPVNDDEKALRRAGKHLADDLLSEAPAGLTTEVFYSLAEFLLKPELGQLPPDVARPLQKFLKKVRANQAAVR